MHDILLFLGEQPLVLLFGLFCIGSALGAVRIADVAIGPAAVLFTAIAVSAVATANDVKLTVPEVVGTLGLVLFTYTIGIIGGPTFFAALRGGWRPIVTVTATLGGVAGVAAVLGNVLGLPFPTIAGTFAGALTNTPALAAATERSGDAAATTVGYSIAYLFGVVGMLVAAATVLRRRVGGSQARGLTNLTIRVERTDEPTVAEVVDRRGGEVVFSRVMHGEPHTDHVLLVAEDDETLREGDLVTVVGPRDVVDAVARELGHRSSHVLQADRRDLDFRRITLSRKELAGRTVEDLELGDKFGAAITRVRRGDVDMVAADDLILLPGDRLRVIAPVKRMKEVSSFLGDSERGLSDINPVGLALGLSLGVLIGTAHIPLPGGGFAIGAAGGTLLVGLVFGRLGRVGPLVTSLAHPAASTLSTFGMLAFLAYAGTRAGGSFTAAVTSSLGWRIGLLGLVLTSLTAVALAVVGTVVHKIDPTRLSGVLGGVQTQPAVLAFANERTGFDTRVALGYALVYPAAMIVKIVLAQILAGG
ncbi:aspartate:alanine exchanger family transporter [Kineosporia sp. R_H_3]|uniref:aspartate:alanine exchanger family transporter n=1 Tax=Kineosporia sp. R_H_3 TaxID=1961848 RepID=UPI000B4B7572|nr:TrkA C-terminal domain-containing protein [Kineosporia sp. R_H_3]